MLWYDQISLHSTCGIIQDTTSPLLLVHGSQKRARMLQVDDTKQWGNMQVQSPNEFLNECWVLNEKCSCAASKVNRKWNEGIQMYGASVRGKCSSRSSHCRCSLCPNYCLQPVQEVRLVLRANENLPLLWPCHHMPASYEISNTSKNKWLTLRCLAVKPL